MRKLYFSRFAPSPKQTHLLVTMTKLNSLITVKRWLRNATRRGLRFVRSRGRASLHFLWQVVNPRAARSSKAGFILPTAMMLLVVMSLVVGAILIRTLNRTQQAVGIREDRVIYNQATPAIDRAKAKLEYLFKIDPRLPAGVPSEDLLANILRGQEALPEGEEGQAAFLDPYLVKSA